MMVKNFIQIGVAAQIECAKLLEPDGFDILSALKDGDCCVL